jgi:hypothetical protein
MELEGHYNNKILFNILTNKFQVFQLYFRTLNPHSCGMHYVIMNINGVCTYLIVNVTLSYQN